MSSFSTAGGKGSKLQVPALPAAGEARPQLVTCAFPSLSQHQGCGNRHQGFGNRVPGTGKVIGGDGSAPGQLFQPPVSDAPNAELKFSIRPSKLCSLFRGLTLRPYSEPDDKPLCYRILRKAPARLPPSIIFLVWKDFAAVDFVTKSWHRVGDAVGRKQIVPSQGQRMRG